MKVLFPIILVSLYNIFHIKSEELSIFWSIILQYKKFHCFNQLLCNTRREYNELKKSRNPKWFLSIILVNNWFLQIIFHQHFFTPLFALKVMMSLFHHSIYDLSSSSFFPPRPEDDQKNEKKKGGGKEKRESMFDPQKVKHSWKGLAHNIVTLGVRTCANTAHACLQLNVKWDARLMSD